MLRIAPPVRRDKWGDGAYQSKRGKRTHAGIDFAAYPGSLVLAARSGEITRIGLAYGQGTGAAGTARPYKYVEIQDRAGFKARYFYLEPIGAVGDQVLCGSVVGVVQDLTERYPGMTCHCHFEVRNADGELIDPQDYDWY